MTQKESSQKAPPLAARKLDKAQALRANLLRRKAAVAPVSKKEKPA